MLDLIRTLAGQGLGILITTHDPGHAFPIGTTALLLQRDFSAMFSPTLALEWATDGIRVNVVSPGMTHTPMSGKMYADPAIKKAREDLIPLSRIGQPKDIANAIEFLISSVSDYITGQDLCVDGGFSMSILSDIPGRPNSAPSA